MNGKGLVQEDELEEFKIHMEKTKKNLTNQLNLLITQKDNYKQLKQKIITDHNNNVFNDKIMILIGDGYFVEKNRKQASEFLERRIQNVGEIISQLSDKIDSFTKLFSISNVKDQKSVEDVNDEGLPFMDVVEELDDDDKVIGVKINNKSVEAELRGAVQKQDGVKYHTAISEASRPPYDPSNEINEELIDIREELDEEGNIINVKLNNEDQCQYSKRDSKLKSTEPEGKKKKSVRFDDSLNKDQRPSDTIDFKSDSEAETELLETNDDDNQYNELLEDMEIVSKPKGLPGPKLNQEAILGKINALRVSEEDRTRIKEIVLEDIKKREEQQSSRKEQAPSKIEEINENDVDEVNSRLTDLAKELIDQNEDEYNSEIDSNEPLQDHIMIENKDLLELELIANEFQDNHEEENENESENDEYDFEFEDEEYDEEEEEEEEGIENFFGNSKMNDLLWSQIYKLRKDQKKPQEDPRDEMEEKRANQSMQEKSTRKKSVSFASELDVVEIEKVSPEDYEAPKRMSRFKQLREREQERKKKTQAPYTEKPVGDIVENPVGDIVENPVGDIVENPVGDIVENPVGDIVENPVGDIVENPVGDIVESPVGDIVENPVGKIGTQQSETKSGINGPKNLECVSRLANLKFGSGESDLGSLKKSELINTDGSDEIELLDMMKQYHLESESIAGPVINEVEDISRLHKLQDQIDVDKYEIHDHDHGHNNKELGFDSGDGAATNVNTKGGQKEKSESNQVISDIIERENKPKLELELRQTIEQQTLESEIQRDYLNLKTRINMQQQDQTPKDPQFEDLDTKPRVSRFKQRLNRG